MYPRGPDNTLTASYTSPTSPSWFNCVIPGIRIAKFLWFSDLRAEPNAVASLGILFTVVETNTTISHGVYRHFSGTGTACGWSMGFGCHFAKFRVRFFRLHQTNTLLQTSSLISRRSLLLTLTFGYCTLGYISVMCSVQHRRFLRPNSRPWDRCLHDFIPTLPIRSCS